MQSGYIRYLYNRRSQRYPCHHYLFPSPFSQTVTSYRRSSRGFDCHHFSITLRGFKPLNSKVLLFLRAGGGRPLEDGPGDLRVWGPGLCFLRFPLRCQSIGHALLLALLHWFDLVWAGIYTPLPPLLRPQLSCRSIGSRRFQYCLIYSRGRFVQAPPAMCPAASRCQAQAQQATSRTATLGSPAKTASQTPAGPNLRAGAAS